ncbi:ATP-binding protein [Roseateles asaccharophilus]|uniref:histidine kinase n=1 Tax=Roseateles asaccharophilus TaxID=582607 RepID=A0ABU2A8N6_9BURK|nr:ATP-binding protein [Roseateles asaccharophilus]MDR7333542.1 PAS domain S-box-containing protein [Roseateles asaccharophilus]
MSAFHSSKPPRRPVRTTLRGARSRDLGLRASGHTDPRWYRQLFQANPLPMWVYDLETLRFLAVNEVACQKYGYTRDEFLAMTIRDIRPPEDIGAVEQSVRLTPAQVFSSGVWRHRFKDGTIIFVLITSHELRYEGRPARFVAPLDVTGRVRAEAALQESEAALRRAQGMAKLSHVVSRPDGSFERWSETLPVLAGYAPQDMPVTTRDWMNRVVHPDDRAMYRSKSLAAARNRCKVEIEYRIVRPDGAIVHIAQVNEPAETSSLEGGGLRWFSTLQDMSAQKRIQAAIHDLNTRLEQRVAERTAQLEATNRDLVAATRAAERANQAKSEFLSHMSHELRTPLNAILGFSQLLAQPGHGYDADRQAVFNGHIHKAGEHLLKLIGDMLNLAQIEAGKLRLNLQLLPLKALLSACEAMVMPQAESHGLRPRFDVPPEDLLVVADGTRLKQVLLNLLSNAIKYNRPGGPLELRVLPGGREHVRIEVRDGGEGLTPAQVGQLFEAFNRLGRSRDGDDAAEGTGLGLVVTRHLVEQMGGRIGVDSQPGVGSCFWVELARGRAADFDAGTEASPDAAAGAPQARTVLLVEDDPSSQELVRTLLGTRPDLRLVIASNGREGIALALAHEPQVILMDNRMPELTGRQALELLGGDLRTAAIPVIAISAATQPPSAGEAEPFKAFRRIAKPFLKDDLLGAIDAALLPHREP